MARDRSEADRAFDEDAGLAQREWPTPQPIRARVEPVPYPLDALPAVIREAAEEVVSFVKAPTALVALSALAAASVAVQAHADVKRAERLAGPCGLFMLVIAESGERKSTCDSYFTAPIVAYERAQAEGAKEALSAHAADLAGWSAEREGVQAAIKQAAKAGDSTDEMKARLRELERAKPESPRVPRLLYGDATPEALTFNLAKSWPSAGIVSSEAGSIFGSHAMGRDSLMRNLSVLNQLWDGKDQTFDRRTSESYRVRGARLTAALQVQEPMLRDFLDRAGALARGSGFLARFLVAWPESTQGVRMFSEAPPAWPALAAYHARIRAILEIDAPLDEHGGLTPTTHGLSPQAKAEWVRFHDAVEADLGLGGALADVRDVAAKAADNAARLACVFHVVAGGAGAIGAEHFAGAARLVAWHLNESRRFFGELALPPELMNAARLDTWLIDRCRRDGVAALPTKAALQYGPVRKADALDAAINELSDLGRVRLLREGRRKLIEVNPALAGG